MNTIQEKSLSLNVFDFAKSGHLNPSPDFVVLTNHKYQDMMHISLDSMCVYKKTYYTSFVSCVHKK